MMSTPNLPVAVVVAVREGAAAVAVEEVVVAEAVQVVAVALGRMV